MVEVVVEGFTNYAPCPRAVLTITGLGESQSVVSVWRISDGGRASVAGARRIAMTDAAGVTDYAVPFGRSVSYEVEVLSGPAGSSRTQSNFITVDPGEGCIMDPLMPGSAVAIAPPRLAGGRPTFSVSAMASFDSGAAVSSFNIMGSREPLVLFGQRQQPAGFDLSLVVDSEDENERLRDLFGSTANLLVRVPKSWQAALPGACFVSVPSVSEQQLEGGRDGDLTLWRFAVDVVSAPTLKPLTGGVTFGDVGMFYTTFQGKHDAVVAAASAAGEQPTFLFDLMNPLG